MKRPKFSVEDFDEALSWFLDGHPDYNYDRKQAGRAVTYTIYNKDREELGLIRIAPGKGQPREVQLSTCSKVGNVNVGSGGPWYLFGSLSDPKYPFNERDREFRDSCALFFLYFRMKHLLDKGGRRLEGCEFLDQGETDDKAKTQATMPDEESAGRLPPVTDPTNQRILEWVKDDPDLTDREIGQRLRISRQAANARRQKLKAMGYRVR